MADMEIVRQFNSELSTLYATKPPISKAKVTSITRLALKAVKYYKHVVQSLEKFVQKCRPEYKIPALYVIDSIIRQSRHQFGAEKDVFGPRFGKNIANSFQNFFKCLPEEQSKLIKVLNLWQKNKVYSPDVIQPLLNMAHTRPMTEQQGSPKLDDDVKAVPADTTQGHVIHHATQQPVASETPQEQAYIHLLQQQQEEQMRHIQELEARLQRQQQMNQHLQHGQPAAETGGEEPQGEPKFQLPTEVFAQIQALASMVNQPGKNPPGSYESEQYSGGGGNYDESSHPGNYGGGHPPDDYGHHYDQDYGHASYGQQPMGDQDYQHTFASGYDENYMASQQHQGFVDDFDYGDDQDDQQRMEEKKRQLEQEANRLKNASSYEQIESINARQRLEEQLRQQQQIVSGIPPQAVPEPKPKQIPETLKPLSESAIPAFQPPAFPAATKSPRSRSRSPRERRHRDGEREYRDSASDRERERGRDRQTEGSDRNRPRNRGERDDRDRTREDRDRARGERDRTREKPRGDRDERERPREERERTREERDRPREERERTREGREKSREKSRENRDERERPREERERTRERERGRDSDKETRVKEEKPAEEKKELKIEKWVPPVKEDHVSVCSRTVWLGRMHRNTTKETLQELFQEYGEVQIIDMVPPRGCAYIQMAEREAAYHSLSSKQLVKHNYKLAWAPAKGAKEYKDHFDKELGVTYIPVAKLQESSDTMSSLAEGGWIDPRTIPEVLVKKEEAAAASKAAGQLPGVLGMPMGPPPFAGMPPGMPRLPFGMPGLPLPGMVPPGMNMPGLPPGMLPQAMGNMPFQRLPPPMNNRLPFIPGVNPFMMPGMLPGAPMPGMPPPPFFRGPPPMSGQPPPAHAPADAGQPQNGNQVEMTGQSNEANQEGTTEPIGPPGESVPVNQGSTETGFEGQSGEQSASEGQNMAHNIGQESQVPEQFGVPNMGPGGAPPFQGGPQFHGGPPFQPQFGQQGQPPFHGNQRFQGASQAGGPPAPWRPAGPDNHWRPEGRPWATDDGQTNENWGNEREHWSTEGEQWRSEDNRWGRGNDRRGRRDRRSQDEWSRDEQQFDRRKRGRFDEDWGPPHDRHQGPHHERHRGRPPFGHPPRFGPGRGPPFPVDGPPPFDDRPPWMRDEQRGRWGSEAMETGFDATQQAAGVEADQQAAGHPNRDPNAPWEGHHGDGSRDIPSLMGGEFKPPPGVPGEGSALPEDTASQESVDKGWAEINELKARLAVNKNQAASSENNETALEGGKVGLSNEQDSVADVKPDVNAIETNIAEVPSAVTHVKEEPLSDEQSDTPDIKPRVNVVEGSADGRGQNDRDNVPENEARVKTEPAEVGDRISDSAEHGGEPEDMNVEVSISDSQSQPVGADVVSPKPAHESPAIAPVVTSTQNEEMTVDEVVERPKDESCVTLPDATTSQERADLSEAVGHVSGPEMEQNVTVDNVYVEKDLKAVGSDVAEHTGDNTGSDEVNMGSDEVTIGSGKDNRGSDDVNRGSDEVNMGSDEVTMGSGKDNRGSDEVNMGSGEVTMGSGEDNRGSDDVNRGSDVVNMGSDEVKADSSEEKVRMGTQEVTMGSRHDNVGSDGLNEAPGMVNTAAGITSDQVEAVSMETRKPEDLEPVAAETTQSEAPMKSYDTNSEFPQNTEDTPTAAESEATRRPSAPTDQVSEQIESSSMDDQVSDFAKESQARVEPDTVVKQEADTTSDVTPGQNLSVPGDANSCEVTDATGEA